MSVCVPTYVSRPAATAMVVDDSGNDQTNPTNDHSLNEHSSAGDIAHANVHETMSALDLTGGNNTFNLAHHATTNTTDMVLQPAATVAMQHAATLPSPAPAQAAGHHPDASAEALPHNNANGTAQNQAIAGRVEGSLALCGCRVTRNHGDAVCAGVPLESFQNHIQLVFVSPSCAAMVACLFFLCVKYDMSSC